MSEGCVTRSCSEAACEGIAMVMRGIVAELCFALGGGVSVFVMFVCIAHRHV